MSPDCGCSFLWGQIEGEEGAASPQRVDLRESKVEKDEPSGSSVLHLGGTAPFCDLRPAEPVCDLRTFDPLETQAVRWRERQVGGGR